MDQLLLDNALRFFEIKIQKTKDEEMIFSSIE